MTFDCKSYKGIKELVEKLCKCPRNCEMKCLPNT